MIKIHYVNSFVCGIIIPYITIHDLTLTQLLKRHQQKLRSIYMLLLSACENHVWCCS